MSLDTTIEPPVDTVTDELFRGHPAFLGALGDTVPDRLVDAPPILDRARQYGFGHPVLEVAHDETSRSRWALSMTLRTRVPA